MFGLSPIYSRTFIVFIVIRRALVCAKYVRSIKQCFFAGISLIILYVCIFIQPLYDYLYG